MESMSVPSRSKRNVERGTPEGNYAWIIEAKSFLCFHGRPLDGPAQFRRPNVERDLGSGVEFFGAPERQHAALRDDVGERGQRFRENRRGLEPHVAPQPSEHRGAPGVVHQ